MWAVPKPWNQNDKNRFELEGTEAMSKMNSQVKGLGLIHPKTGMKMAINTRNWSKVQKNRRAFSINIHEKFKDLYQKYYLLPFQNLPESQAGKMDIHGNQIFETWYGRNYEQIIMVIFCYSNHLWVLPDLEYLWIASKYCWDVNHWPR